MYAKNYWTDITTLHNKVGDSGALRLSGLNGTIESYDNISKMDSSDCLQ